MGRQDERNTALRLPRDEFNAGASRTGREQAAKRASAGYFTTFFGANDSSNVAHARRERAFLYICHRGGDVIKIFSPPAADRGDN
jgi:hypothetical protein